MRAQRILPLLAAIAVVAGCSTQEPPAPKVATLETPQAAASSAAGEPAKQASRPRYRLDMTPEEEKALDQAYNRCMDEHLGLPPSTGDGSGQPTDMAPSTEQKTKYDEAVAQGVCEDKRPLPAWEKDVSNPESQDFVQKVVRCVRDRGVRFVEVIPAQPGDEQWGIALGGPQNDSASISDGLRLIPECEKDIAAGGSR